MRSLLPHLLQTIPPGSGLAIIGAGGSGKTLVASGFSEQWISGTRRGLIWIDRSGDFLQRRRVARLLSLRAARGDSNDTPSSRLHVLNAERFGDLSDVLNGDTADRLLQYLSSRCATCDGVVVFDDVCFHLDHPGVRSIIEKLFARGCLPIITLHKESDMPDWLRARLYCLYTNGQLTCELSDVGDLQGNYTGTVTFDTQESTWVPAHDFYWWNTTRYVDVKRIADAVDQHGGVFSLGIASVLANNNRAS